MVSSLVPKSSNSADMSGLPTTASLKNKKKPELKDLAAKLGLSTKGLRNELEDRIRVHIESQKSEQEEEEDNSGGENQALPSPTQSSRKKSSPTNKSRGAKPNLNGDSRSDESDVSVENKVEEPPYEGTSTVYITRVRSTTIVTQRRFDFKKILKFEAINDAVVELRRYVTNTHTLVIATIALQLLVFLYYVFDWIKLGTVPIGFLSTESKAFIITIRGPDLTVLADWHQFWRPLLVYQLYLVILPLLFGYIFNLEPHRHEISPLAFSVAQYCSLFSSSGNLDWVEDTRQYIPESLTYSCAGASIIFSVYEILLSNTGRPWSPREI